MTQVLNRDTPYFESDNLSTGILTNDFSYQKIILSISDESKSVKQISKETGLPLSTTYRKIKELNKNHLLILSGNINSENKREFRYKSKTGLIVREFFAQGKPKKVG